MEHAKNFANLIETLSAKFPDLDVKKQLEYIAEAFSAEFPDLAPFRYLYIIAGLTGNFSDKQFLSFFPVILLSRFFSRESVYLQKHGKGIDSIITTSIFTQDQTKEAIEYLVSRIFDSLNSIFPLSHRSWDEIIDDLANREPDAVQIETTSSGEKIESIDWNKLSYSALNEFTRREIHSALQNPQYLFPSKELERTLVELAAPKSEQIVYNPNCGVGSIFVEFEKQYPNHNLKYYGILSDKFSELLCNANLFVNGINAEINNEGLYSKNPSFNEELSILEGVESDNISFYDEDSSEWRDTNVVDIAVGIPEFTERVYLGKYKPLEMLSRKEFTRNEYALVEEMLSRLNETGKAIVVVPNSSLFSSHGKSYREKYLSLDLIERVISLPDDTFKPQGSIKTSIIVFNKNKSNKNIILFDGKEDKFEKTQIRVDSIISENKTDLSPTRYALKEGKELRNIFAHTQYPVKKIKNLIVSPSILGRNFPQNSTTIGNGSNGKVPFIRVSELSKIGEDFNLDISKIERKISQEKVPQNQLIDFDAVLVNLIGNKLKPTYFKFDGKPIVIGSDVIALKMNEDINVEYFLTQLHSRLVQIQVEMFSSGTIINRISKEDFLNIQILLPSLEEQKHRVEEFRDSVFKVAKEVVEAESERDEIEYQTIANMNHSLKNKLGAIVGGYDTLVRFLKRKERENAPVKFDEPIFPVREGENVEDIDTIATITERLKKHLLDASNVFDSFEKIEQLKLNKETVELVSYFKNELKPLYSGGNFTIEVLAKPKLKLYVLIDKNSFKDIIENLIENARKHGFVSEDRKYKIVFELSERNDIYDEESETYESYASILYKNDGKSFPKGFSFSDFTEYSNKAGKNQGMGIGGSIISRQIKKHGGKLNCISIDETNSLFPIQFEILLPLDD